MPRGDACRLSLSVVHRGPGGPQDGPGCATPALGDPCRTRTCVRCVRGSRPTARRTGRGYRFERKVEVRTPRPSRPPPGSRPGAGHSSSTFQSMVSPVRFERTTPAFGGQRSVPLSYGEVAPEARFKLTSGASQAPVLFTTPPGSDTMRRTASDAYGTRTRTSRIDGPALFHRAHASGGTASLSRAGRNRTGGLGAPNAARSQPALQPVKAQEGGVEPPPPGSEPGVLPATPLPKDASPEDRTPIRGVRARPVTGYRRDARGGSPARSNERRRLSTGHRVDAEGGVRHQRVEVIGGGRTPARVRTERIELSWTRSAGF